MSTETIIPERGTKEFAIYKAEVEWWAQHGEKIEWQWLDTSHPERWNLKVNTTWTWDRMNYRVAPEPHPIDQWRAMSPEEREGKVLECKSKIHEDDWSLSVLTAYPDDPIPKGTDKAVSKWDYRIRELSLAERNAEVRKRWEAMEETNDKAVRRDKEGKLWTYRYSNTVADLDEPPEWLNNLEYRIVEVPEPPKPKYVPWTRETCPVGAVVRHKESGNRGVISIANERCLFVFGNAYEYYTAMETLTMADGSPCGTQSNDNE